MEHIKYTPGVRPVDFFFLGIAWWVSLGFPCVAIGIICYAILNAILRHNIAKKQEREDSM